MKKWLIGIFGVIIVTFGTVAYFAFIQTDVLYMDERLPFSADDIETVFIENYNEPNVEERFVQLENEDSFEQLLNETSDVLIESANEADLSRDFRISINLEDGSIYDVFLNNGYIGFATEESPGSDYYTFLEGEESFLGHVEYMFSNHSNS